MKVFMLGWEFPPHISGGLGTACQGLTRGLGELGAEVSFVLPTAVPIDPSSHVQLRTPAHAASARRARLERATTETLAASGLGGEVTLHRVPALLQAYAGTESFAEVLAKLPADVRQAITDPSLLGEPGAEAGAADGTIAPVPGVSGRSFHTGAGANYGEDLMSQVHRYASLSVELSGDEAFDVVHAHDWMTYPAGIAVSSATGKPLVIHVHSTEFDRAGDNVNQQVYDIERMGMHAASRVVAVSHLTKRIVTSRYGVPEEKVRVVYNATELPAEAEGPMRPIMQDEKIVLFLGRLTMQKGPDYFLEAARKVVDKFPKVRFVMAGSGDMIRRCIEMCADLKLGSHVTFTGFLRGGDVDRVFQMADLFVMPSVSEPFGIAPLEAISHNVPVIISKQSGVSEVLTHALKVDFWDVDEIANKVLAVLRHPPLQKTLRQHGQIELRKLSWRDSAEKLIGIYREVATTS
jgi:glycosyltransferase involved in cell wall biosynthesis